MEQNGQIGGHETDVLTRRPSDVFAIFFFSVSLSKEEVLLGRLSEVDWKRALLVLSELDKLQKRLQRWNQQLGNSVVFLID